jgi:hypothetical protein
MTIFFFFDPSIIISINTQKQNNLTREGEGLKICNALTRQTIKLVSHDRIRAFSFKLTYIMIGMYHRKAV